MQGRSKHGPEVGAAALRPPGGSAATASAGFGLADGLAAVARRSARASARCHRARDRRAAAVSVAARRGGGRRHPLSLGRSRAGSVDSGCSLRSPSPRSRGSRAPSAPPSRCSSRSRPSRPAFSRRDGRARGSPRRFSIAFALRPSTGFVEQMDYRRAGRALRAAARRAPRASSPEQTPRRIRLTDRYRPAFEAGAFVKLKARLLPPARAALPGGYDFARDAYFAEIGAVGNVLGKIEATTPPAPPGAGAHGLCMAHRPHAQRAGRAGRTRCSAASGARSPPPW